MKPKLILIVCFVLQCFVSFSETEPNNTAAQANILLFNGTQSGSVSDTDGADWYILRVPQGGILTLMLNSDGGPETTVYLKDSAQVNTDLAYGGFYFGNKTKDSIVSPLLKGTYYVAVIRSRGSGTYSIGSSLKILQWKEDVEPDNEAAKALTLPVNGSVTGLIGHYDPRVKIYDPADWYKITVPQGGNLKLQFYSDGGPEANFYLSDSSQVGTSLSNAGLYFGNRTRDSISFPVLKGTYFLQCLKSRGSGSYKIESKLQILQWSEDKEINNDGATALTLPVNGSFTGLIGHYDPGVKTYDPEDWYKITVPQGGNLRLQFYSDGGPEANFYLSDSSQVGTHLSYAGFSFGNKTRDSISFPVLKGTYFLRCLKSRGSGSYKIESKLQILQWSEDKEINNDGATALTLPVNGSVTGLIGHYDPGVKTYDPEDWYKITVPQGGNLRFQFYSDGGPEAYFYLSDSSQVSTHLANAGLYFGNRTRDSISFPVLKGTYFLRCLKSRGSGAYKIESSFKVPIWSEDIEPNNNQQNALKFPVNTSLSGLINYYNPSIKNFDTEDWYKIKTDKAGYLVINLNSDSLVEASIYLKDSLNIGSSISSASFSFSDRTKDSLVSRIKAGTYYMVVYRSRGSGRYRATSKLMLPPQSQFTYTQTGNVFTFENKTLRGVTYLWKFDDGTSATTVSAYHEYTYPGSFNVCLIATNSGGIDTTCQVATIPGVARAFPNVAGNIGDVTITIYGGALDTFFTISLVKNENILVSSSSEKMFGKKGIYTVFDLRQKPVGKYDIFVQKQGGPKYIIPNGFEIVQGIAADPWVNIGGRDRMLFNTWTTFTINYGNRGNVDATGVPLFIAISDVPGLQLEFKDMVTKTTTYAQTNGLTTLLNIPPEYAIVDSIFGEAKKMKVYAFYIPEIPSGALESITLRLKASQTVDIRAWVYPPYFQSPIDGRLAACWLSIVGEAIADGIGAALPSTTCLINTGKLVYNPFESARDPEKKTWGIWFHGITSALVACGFDVAGSTIGLWHKQLFVFLINFNKHRLNYRKCKESYDPYSLDYKPVQAVNSLDPNEKAGLSGYGVNNYLRATTGFPYTIYFENKSTATAPAHQISITDKLDPAVFDLKSFSFGKVTIGDSTIFVPSGLRVFTLDKKLKNLNVVARVSGKLDTITGNIEWLFRSLDPKTLDDVEDPDIGILPPNTKSPSGEGNVSYFVKLKNEPRHNQQIKNKASIVFDANPAIITNEYIVTFDLVAPQSSVQTIKPTTATRQFTVNWSGTDDGSGVQSYDIYVKSGTEPYKIWLSGATATSAIFSSPIDGVYQFSSVAVDKTGNSELLPAIPDASTNVITGLEERVLPVSEVKVIQMPNSDNLILNIGMHGQFTFRVFGVDGKLITQQEVIGNSITTIKSLTLPYGMCIWQLMDTKTNKIKTGKLFMNF